MFSTPFVKHNSVLKSNTYPNCMACGKLVDGDGVMLEKDEKVMMMKEKGKEQEKVYHRHCLTCSYCTNTIEGKFFTQDGSVVCGPCASDQVITQAVHKTKLSKS